VHAPTSDLRSCTGKKRGRYSVMNGPLEGENPKTHCINFEGCPTPPGQLKWSIKRIPKHHIIRTDRSQKPPSAKEKKCELFSLVQKIVTMYMVKRNAPDLNAPRNTFPFHRAEVRRASLPPRPPPPPSEEQEEVKGPGPTKSKICTTTAPSNVPDWMWYGVDVSTRWEAPSSASGEVDGPVSTHSRGI